MQTKIQNSVIHNDESAKLSSIQCSYFNETTQLLGTLFLRWLTRIGIITLIKIYRGMLNKIIFRKYIPFVFNGFNIFA